MSWLGGSFSSLTGQLSNLTKDILTEGTEEVSDHVTELKLAQDKIKELDTVNVSQKIEIDRLKLMVKEWEEKAEGSELQINRISNEYRTLLEEKEREIKKLKLENQELKNSGSFINQESQAPAVLRLDSDNGFESVSYGSDEHDFGDNIAMQHDINRLRGDLRRIEAECKHWKSLVDQSKSTASVDHTGIPQSSSDDSQLQKQLQALQDELAREKDLRQHEISALQDSHTHKMSQMRKKHREEVAELRAKMQEMDWGSEGWETLPSADALEVKTLKEQITSLQNEREDHLSEITSLSEVLEQYKSELAIKEAQTLHLENQLKVAKEEISRIEEERDQVGEQLYDSKQKLLDQLDANHADTLEVLSDLREVRQHMDMTAIDRRNKLLLDKDIYISQLINITDKKKIISAGVEKLEADSAAMKEETTSMIQNLGDTEKQKITGEIVDSLEKENLVLREKNVSLQEQVTLLEKAIQNVSHEPGKRTTSAGLLTEDVELASESGSLNSDFSELSRRNFELDEHVNTLKGQIRNFEDEIKSFEALQADWESEKETLETVLGELKTKLKEENILNAVEAEKGLLAVERYEANKSDLPDLIDETNRETVDRESMDKDSMDDIAEDVVELDRKVGLLTEANAQLEQERDMLVEEQIKLKKELDELKASQAETSLTESTEASELKSLLMQKEEELRKLMDENEELVEQIPTLTSKLQEKQDEIDDLNKSNAEEFELLEKEKEDLKKKLRGKNEDIVNLSLEKEEVMQSLEELDTQHNEAMQHVIQVKDQLKKSNDEYKARVQSLEAEIQTLKSQQMLTQEDESSSSNELNHQIAELKDEVTELTGRLEKQENQINTLEKEKQVKDEKIKEMVEKMSSGAVALNDLHMDKQELQNQLSELKNEISKQSEKIKSLRDENDKLKSEPVKSEENIQQSASHEHHRLEEEYNDMKMKIDNVEAKSKQVTQENDYLKAQLDEINEKCISLTKSLELRNDEVGKMSDDLSESHRQISELKEKLESVSSDYDRLKQESEKIHGECESFSTHTHVVEKELQTVKDDNVAKEKEITYLSNQVEMFNNELTLFKDNMVAKETECEKMTEEITQAKDLLQDTTDRLHSKCEENNELAAALAKVKDELEAKVYEKETEYDAQLLSATGELVLVKEELEHKTEEVKQLDSLLYAKETELSELKAFTTNLLEELKHHVKEIENLEKEKLDNENNTTKANEKINELEKACQSITSENDRLKAELSALDQKLTSQVTHYETYIEQLKTNKETDSSALQLQYDEMLEKYHIKELLISELEEKVMNSFNQLVECQKELEVAVENANSLQLICDNYKKDLAALEESTATLKLENSTLNDQTKEKEQAWFTLENEKAQLSRTLESERENSAQEISMRDNKISELISEKADSEKEVQTLIDLCAVKDKEITDLKNDLSNNVKLNANDDPDAGVIEESVVKVQHAQLHGTASGNLENETVKHERDVSIEIDKLKGQLAEKDSVISELQRNNASLLKMLDAKAKNSGDTSHIDILNLENEVKSLKKEREQMMDVLNEKSRESSSQRSEVQRLMNVVAAQKSALDKLQQDNQELSKKSPEGDSAHIDDMQKQVVQNLSRIIRDKDLEIESLTQKNQTLLSVLQESSNEGSQINSLMQDKDNLMKQIASLQTEREQMIAYLNQKHQESVAYHNEVQRLTALINTESQSNQEIKYNYELLKPQFEDNKQALVKTQNELLNYKQKYQELEVKCGQLVQQSDSGGSVDKSLYEAKATEVEKLQERFNELTLASKEKEMRIQNLTTQLNELENNLRVTENERGGYKKQVDNFTFQLHGIQTEHGDLKVEVAQLTQQKDAFALECHQLKELNNRLSLQAQDSNFQIQSLQEKIQSLTSMLQEQQGEKGQLQTVIQESESTKNQIRQLMQERDQALLRLQHREEESLKLLQDIQNLKEKEAKLNRELGRLREHLIQIEDGYTKEALAAEEREKELRTRLVVAEESALTSTSAVETANQQAVQQVESLRQQLQFASQQRDQAYQQITNLQNQNQMYSSSMTNLEMVLEEFQQDKDRLVAEETERCIKEVQALRAQVNKLQTELKSTKDQLEEASDGLEAAARLSEQLDRKEDAIDALREEVQIRESTLKTVEEELRALKNRNDDRVDKQVIKNLFLGYFSTPQNKRHEVLRTIGGVLLFSADDFEKIEGTHKGGWVPGFLRFSGGQTSTSPPGTPARRSTIGTPVARPGDNSFSQMFVKFLERESSPPPPTVRLPAEEMVKDVQQKHKEAQKTPFNPFTAPRHVAMPTSTTITTGTQNSHILISPGSLVTDTFPTFAPPSQQSKSPPGSGRNTPATSSSAFLKDVLNR